MRGPRDVVPMPESCPWGGWLPPDIQHCEENLCAWIAAPADTWSNLAYLLAALWLWRRAAAEPAGGRGAGRWFGPVAAAVGLSSFAFHASFTFAFQFFDYAGMFLWVMLLLTLNLERLRWLAAEYRVAFYWTGVGASGACLLGLRNAGLPVQPIIAAQALGILLTEAILASRGASWTRYRHFASGLGLMAAGLACWMLDYRRVLCDPADHVFQWHAAWHWLTAASFIPLERFYVQEGRELSCSDREA